MVYLIATVLLSLLLFAWLKERVLYLVFPWAYIQNFVLASAYTSGLAGKPLCQALLILKEFLLLWLFLQFLPQLKRCGHGAWPPPLRILGYFTAWCVVRYVAAVILQGEGLMGNLWNLRVACFPFEILTVAVGVAWVKPDFAKRFIRHMSCLLAAVALVGVLLYILPGPTFWRDNVNVSTYNFEVKGGESGEDSSLHQPGGADVQEQQEGLPGNGRGREGFSSMISPFRAIGTVCDAVGFGHLVAFPVLLLAFYLPQNWKTRLMLGVTLSALFFTFTRSAWVFALLGSIFVLHRRKRRRLLLAIAALVVIPLILWTPMAEWYSSSLAMLSTNNADDHIRGIMWLYQEGIWDIHSWFGQGMSSDIPEGGYGVLLVRFGLPAVLIILWFSFALYRSLKENPFRERPLFIIAQVVPLTLLVTMLFSFYPFSFIPYLLTWFVVGTCLAFAGHQAAARNTHHASFERAIS